jgi:hypothetical protein
MGMYTELHFNAELRADTPQPVLAVLRYMIGDNPDPADLPAHPFFGCARWRNMLRSDSYYFAADTHCTLRYDKNAGAHILCIRTNFKNYDSEIEQFIDWIMPYLEKHDGEFLGFSRYAETNAPTLIYTPMRTLLATEAPA